MTITNEVAQLIIKSIIQSVLECSAHLELQNSKAADMVAEILKSNPPYKGQNLLFVLFSDQVFWGPI